MKFYGVEGPRRKPGVKKKFQKLPILIFEVIVQPLKVCLGGCTITSKIKINVFCKKFLHSEFHLRAEPSILTKFQKTLILAFVANTHCPAKMDFFPSFNSLCFILGLAFYSRIFVIYEQFHYSQINDDE